MRRLSQGRSPSSGVSARSRSATRRTGNEPGAALLRSANAENGRRSDRADDKGALHLALTRLAEQDPLINLRQDDVRQELFVSLYGEVVEEFRAAIEDYVLTTLRQGLFGWRVTDCTVTMTQSGYASPGI